jgi:hypothetical protein
MVPKTVDDPWVLIFDTVPSILAYFHYFEIISVGI